MTTAPLRTGGLRHVNLLVADVARSVAFYRSALGLEPRAEKHGITFLTTPGTDDSLALQQAGGDLDRSSGRTRTPGDGGGVDHIGFLVRDPDQLDRLVAAVEAHGGTVLMRRDPETGAGTTFVADPDGYVIELGE